MLLTCIFDDRSKLDLTTTPALPCGKSTCGIMAAYGKYDHMFELACTLPTLNF